MNPGATLERELASLPGDAVLLLAGTTRITARELLGRSLALRRSWASARGARVALRGQSAQDLVESLLALDGIAQAIVLLPGNLTQPQQALLIEQGDCALMIDSDRAVHRTSDAASRGERCASWTEWILATSGTTGDPKLVGHTLASLTRTVNRDIERGSKYVWGLVYDPCRFAGLQVLLQSLLGGSRMAFPSGSTFDEQVSALLLQGVNALSATPSLWRKLLMDGRIRQLPLRQITLGGELADQKILDSLKAAYPHARIVHIYASTEAGSSFAVRDGLAGFPHAWLHSKRAPISMRVDGDGHLRIRPAILGRCPLIDGRLDSDGYLDTEDLVRIEGDRVYFMGRASGVINVGGNKVHPDEVEACIRAVSGVVDARVFAKSSSMMGQLVAAEVVPMIAEQGTQELRSRIQAHCRRSLAAWQCPAMITFVGELKETGAGKRSRKSA